MKPLQCRMARAGLGWSAEQLGRKAGLTRRCICRFETEGRTRPVIVDRLAAALFDGGARFDSAGEWLGVSIRRNAEETSAERSAGRRDLPAEAEGTSLPVPSWGIADAPTVRGGPDTLRSRAGASEYYLSRASESAALARAATDPAIASIHRELWLRYMSLAETAGAVDG